MANPVVDGVIESAKGAIVRHGAGLAFEAAASRLRRVGDASLAPSGPPTFTTGATAVIAGTTLVLGGALGWKLNDWLKGRKR